MITYTYIIEYEFILNTTSYPLIQRILQSFTYVQIRTTKGACDIIIADSLELAYWSKCLLEPQGTFDFTNLCKFWPIEIDLKCVKSWHTFWPIETKCINRIKMYQVT